MANIVPPIPPSMAGSTAASTAGPSAAPALTLANPPQGLTQVAPGTAIQGTVVASETPGTLAIQTPVGTLNVPSTLTLPNNAVLSLLLQSLTPQARLLITAINGQPPGQILQSQPGNTPTARTPGAPGGTAAALPAVSVSVGAAPVITAIVLPQSSSHGQPGATLQTNTPNTAQSPAAATVQGAGGTTTAIGALAQLAKSATGKIGLSNTTGGSTTTPSGAPPSAPSSSAAGQAPNLLSSPYQAGTQIPVRVTNVQPPTPGMAPALPSLSPAPLSVGQIITGVLTGTTPAGLATVQTPAGQLSLPIEAAPQGSIITLEITGRPLVPAPLNTTPTSALDFSTLSREWPALKEALQALQESNPGIAQQLINMIIPRLDMQLASNLLLFLIGLRGGDIRGWLGEEPMRALEDARPELARQLRAEFGQLARLADDPGTGDWRHMLIPLNTGDAIEQIHMFMRQRKQEQEGGGNTETRFVIDVGLSRLGRIQLDGLIGEQNKRLDLIIRSQNPLPNQMQNDIRTIYVNTGGITGLTGGLSFQAAPPNFVEIDAPATPESSQSGIIA